LIIYLPSESDRCRTGFDKKRSLFCR